MRGSMRRAAILGTAIVLAHLLINVLHVVAHAELTIYLNRADTTFVIAVIGICPLLVMCLLWTSRVRAGLVLLTVAMAASLLFGFYHHFVVVGSDHIGHQVLGLWATTFVISAYGLL